MMSSLLDLLLFLIRHSLIFVQFTLHLLSEPVDPQSASKGRSLDYNHYISGATKNFIRETFHVHGSYLHQDGVIEVLASGVDEVYNFKNERAFRNLGK